MPGDKILIINLCSADYPGGVERVLASIETLLSQAGYKVDWLVEEALSPRQIFFLAILSWLRLKEFAINIIFARKLSRGEEYAAIITNGFYGMHIKRKCCIHIYHGTVAGYRRAVASHLSFFSHLRLQSMEMLERFSGRGKTVVAVSEYCAKELKRYYGLSTSHIIENAVDTSFFTPVFDEERKMNRQRIFESDAPVIIFVGRVEYAKGADILNEIIYLSQKKYNFLICAGEMEETYRIRNTSNVIYMLGLNPAAMKTAYRSADVFLLPSRYEGYGLAVAEALSSGIPVVGSKVGLMSDIHKRDSVIGHYILDTDADASEYLQLIDEAVADRERLSILSREYILQVHDPELYSKRWQQIVFDLNKSNIADNSSEFTIFFPGD
ncbi:MAG: glycosyltransferase family 4 protein [bacterium]|nr:glycosyltransferase family 4 protein [bacterium]MDD3805350.1 glycosyltransferase family 4 protein [bacterium]MDD4153273.1 glycosyltransferase family 4 protein [bacterium]